MPFTEAARPGAQLEIGIGLNSGEVVAGEHRRGPAVRPPRRGRRRVEAATRETGDMLLLAQRTAALLRRDQVELE
jgi:hypothetical protein